MGSGVGDVGDPGLIGLGHLELPLEVIWRDHRGLATSHSRPAALADLSARAFEPEQLRHAMHAAELVPVRHPLSLLEELIFRGRELIFLTWWGHFFWRSYPVLLRQGGAGERP